MDTGDKRRFPRFKVLECAMFYTAGATEPLRGIIADIGLGGVQLHTKLPLPLEVMCKIVVGRDGKPPLDINGVVVYSHPGGEDQLYISGFKFIPQTKEERLDVANYVHSMFQRQWEELAG